MLIEILVCVCVLFSMGVFWCTDQDQPWRVRVSECGVEDVKKFSKATAPRACCLFLVDLFS